MSETKSTVWAIVGSPNTGKTTVFNALTGQRAKVGNYAGITVDLREGEFSLPGTGERVKVIDLPGTYSVEALSEDEEVAVKILEGRIPGIPKPDGLIFVADAGTLPRTIPLLASFFKYKLPIILVVTMLDELERREGSIDIGGLEEELGIPCVGVIGIRRVGIDELKGVISAITAGLRTVEPPAVPSEVEERFQWADRVLERHYRPPQRAPVLTDRIDRILLHPVFGILIFIGVMFVFFQAIFAWAAPLQDLCEAGVGFLASYIGGVLPDGWVKSFVVDGLIGGVGSVVVFVPQIALLFLLLGFFELSGYLSRAVFVIDRVMSGIGLDGRSFVSLLSSFACAVPGILSARNIPDPKHRLVTILITPLMTCSARLPVYVLLIAAFIPDRKIFGFVGLQGLVMFGLYFTGALFGMLVAFVFRKTIIRGDSLPFYIELPPYRWPTPRLLFFSVWLPVKRFLRRIGTVILGVSVLLWLMLNFPPPPEVSPSAEGGSSERTASGGEASKRTLSSKRSETPGSAPSTSPSGGGGGVNPIEWSLAGRLGRLMEPIFAPIGYDWRVTLGVISSLAAREVIISTLSQIYSIQGGDSERLLVRKLRAELKPPPPYSGHERGGLAVALSLLVFFAFALQCISTIATMYRELQSWKWPLLITGVYFIIAYLFAGITFHLTLLL